MGLPLMGVGDPYPQSPAELLPAVGLPQRLGPYDVRLVGSWFCLDRPTSGVFRLLLAPDDSQVEVFAFATEAAVRDGPVPRGVTPSLLMGATAKPRH